jgi:acyl-coenzyme A thioesterase PaaI-like protein
MEIMESLQDKYSPNAVCFGCGPANPKGLHIKSRPEGDRLVADWMPEPQHMAFAGFTNGGIIATLLDCHGNMTAAYSLMKARGLEVPPGTVTAELAIKFLRPSPLKKELHLSAWCTGIEGGRVRVEGSLEVDGVKTASMSGLYVAVKEGHPAFHKWE